MTDEEKEIIHSLADDLGTYTGYRESPLMVELNEIAEEAKRMGYPSVKAYVQSEYRGEFPKRAYLAELYEQFLVAVQDSAVSHDSPFNEHSTFGEYVEWSCRALESRLEELGSLKRTRAHSFGLVEKIANDPGLIGVDVNSAPDPDLPSDLFSITSEDLDFLEWILRKSLETCRDYLAGRITLPDLGG